MKKKEKAKESQTKKRSVLIQMDTIPNLLKLPGKEKFVKDLLRQKLEQDLNKRISRYKELPAFIVELRKKHEEYPKLLHEARSLYIEGKFYSCVAMCGVTSERIAKDVLRRIILVKKFKKASPSKFFNQIDRIPMDVIRELLIWAGAVDKSLRDAFIDLANLRNKYVHARRVGSKADAQKAIKYLHEIVEGTASVFKKYKIQQGKLVKK